MPTDLLERGRTTELVPERRLRAEDFIQPLYLTVMGRTIELTGRERVRWGQESVLLKVITHGYTDHIAVFDRPHGGSPVLRARVGVGRNRKVVPYLILVVRNMRWPSGGAR